MRARLAPIILILLACTTACGAQQQARSARRAEFWGFTGPWEAASDSSVRQHGRALDAVVTGWIGLDSLTSRPLLPSPYPDTLLGRSESPARMAIVTSWHGDRFHPRTIRRLAATPQLLAATARTIADHAATSGYRGLVLDFEGLDPGDLAAQLGVIGAIATAARTRGVATIAVAIPAGDTAGYPARKLLTVADYVVVMLYDQHWTGSEPGPIAAPEWVKASLAARVAEAGMDRVVAGLPTYTYRWRRGKPTEILGYRDAVAIAKRESVPLKRDAATGTLRARQGDAWDMWITDAPLLVRLVGDARAAGVYRFALWRLGEEDPAIWSFIGR